MTTRRTGIIARRLRDLPYEKRVCRIEHYPRSLEMTTRGPGTVNDPAVQALMAQEINAIASAGTEVWAINSTRGRGIPLWPSNMLPVPSDVDPELLPRFLDLAHAKGLIMLTYYPFIFTKPLLDVHPEWMIQMLDDGGPEVWNEGWFCWNSPYRDWLADYLIEMLDHLDFDGVYFDDMNWGTHSDTGQRRAGGCCCSYCQRLYRQETGRELPRRVEMASADFKRFVNWRYDKFREGVAHVALRVHERYPDAILDWNYYGRPYGSPDTGWQTAHPLNPVAVAGTYFFMEAGLDNLGASFPVKLLQACGPTFGVWLWATQILPEVASHSAPYPEPHTAMLHALYAVAHGGASVTTCLDAGAHTMYGDALASVFTELKRLRPYVGGDRVKHVALHVSQQTRDFGYMDAPDDFWRLMRGSNEMLKRAHLLTDVVFDQQLTAEQLSDYAVLYLSNSKCLSDAQGAAIRQFVAQGGTLIATHETSLYDELGQRRDNFGLADVLGVDYQRPPSHGDPLTDDAHGKVNPADSNIYIPQTAELQAHFGHFVAFGARQSTIAVRAASSVRTLFTKSNLTWDGGPPLSAFHAGRAHDSGAPAVTICDFGQGKAIYICGDVGEGYDRNPLPQLQRLVARLIHATAPPAIEVNAPRVLAVTAWQRSPHELMIYLLNDPLAYLPWDTSRGDRRKYFYLDEVLPVHDVTVTLRGYKAKSATLPLQGQDLVLQGNPVTLTIPRIHLHEVVLVQLA